jgi:predicted nucleic acid-binding protein
VSYLVDTDWTADWLKGRAAAVTLLRSLAPGGLLIGDIDLLIAATALVHGDTLLTRNVRHFQRIPGLRLYQPTST